MIDMSRKARFYGQHGEDFLLWEFFDHKVKGFFIDVGAFDGIHFSNTFMFEQLGWRGICIEANPEYANRCAENRPGSECLNVACTSVASDSIEFFAEELGLLSGLDGGKEKCTDIRQRYKNRGLEYKGLTSVFVKGVTLDDVFSQKVGAAGKVDVLSIDVEGHEVDVLSGFDARKWCPRIIVVEANTEEDKVRIEKYMDNAGYVYARRLGVNMFYVMSCDDRDKLNDVYVRCVVERQVHPLGEKYTPKEYLRSKIIDQDIEELIDAKNLIISKKSRQVLSLQNAVSNLQKKNAILVRELSAIRGFFPYKVFRRMQSSYACLKLLFMPLRRK